MENITEDKHENDYITLKHQTLTTQANCNLALGVPAEQFYLVSENRSYRSPQPHTETSILIYGCHEYFGKKNILTLPQ